MVEVRNTEQEIHQLRQRLAVASVLIFLALGALGARFFYLQVVRFSDFHAQAEDNRIALVPIAPPRGLIYDRNGVLLADNVSAYTLELRPDRVDNLEGLIEQLQGVVEITARDKRRFKRLLEDSKNFESIPLKTRLTDEEVARLAAARFRFPAIEIRARQFRTYPLGEVGAHLLGYIGRISPDEKRKLEEQGLEAAYAGSTHIGKIGLEQSYERLLHGQAGSQRVEVSAGGRIVRSLSATPAVAGNNLMLSVDFKLQKLTEEWFGQRKGALVAIEPATGDVLAFVSKPSYDPNAFVDGIDPQLWKELNDDPDKPLLNRPLRGTYPPGSTYKPFMALAVLETGTRAPQTTISDPGYFALGGHRFRDSKPTGHGSVNLSKSIVVSSDTYYYSAAYDMGVDKIHDFMKPWGFGQLTGIDLDNESAGILPSSAWKMKRYKQKWLPGETPSIGIGQGYNTFTMLQLAHATATLANNGVVMRPHLVKTIENPLTRERVPTTPKPERTIALRPEYLELVRQAMIDVNRFGTSRIAFANTEYVAAGKTGTAQVIGIKQGERYVASRIAERFRDHSLFMAFAPADNPRIALAVIVENGGFGAQAAAPIARKVFDYYLLGKLPKDTPPPLIRSEDEAARDEAVMRDVPLDMTPEPIEAPR
jgi:penicillin-binding protein 2